jgi:hypothetical protein
MSGKQADPEKLLAEAMSVTYRAFPADNDDVLAINSTAHNKIRELVVEPTADDTVASLTAAVSTMSLDPSGASTSGAPGSMVAFGSTVGGDAAEAVTAAHPVGNSTATGAGELNASGEVCAHDIGLAQHAYHLRLAESFDTILFMKRVVHDSEHAMVNTQYGAVVRGILYGVETHEAGVTASVPGVLKLKG